MVVLDERDESTAAKVFPASCDAAELGNSKSAPRWESRARFFLNAHHRPDALQHKTGMKNERRAAVAAIVGRMEEGLRQSNSKSDDDLLRAHGRDMVSTSPAVDVAGLTKTTIRIYRNNSFKNYGMFRLTKEVPTWAT